MAKQLQKHGSIKRFGPRYGRTVKDKLDAIEALQHQKQLCPYCAKLKVKRVAAGIWQCLKCNNKFTGKAYYLPKPGTGLDEEETVFVERKTRTKKEKGTRYTEKIGMVEEESEEGISITMQNKEEE